jgi:hypothetical protein
MANFRKPGLEFPLVGLLDASVELVETARGDVAKASCASADVRVLRSQRAVVEWETGKVDDAAGLVPVRERLAVSRAVEHDEVRHGVGEVVEVPVARCTTKKA